jgi:hypothetical protein
MSAQHEELRKLVRSMLESAPAYAALEQPERQKLARTLVDVLGYLTDPAPSGEQPRAQALDDANAALKARLAQKQDFASKDFVAGAARAGTQQFKNMVSTVDFPKFVSGLVEGVYTSIVNSSIRQMQAYGQMLEGIAKSVDQFAKENISADEARQFVQTSFPGQVQLDPDSGKLALADDTDSGDGETPPPPDFKAALGMPENVELNEDNEAKIVLAAQVKMARQRQQLLAQMVAMGINRIIVTDGEIKASVLFDMRAKDTAQRTATASTSDVSTSSHGSSGGWASDIFGGDSDVQTNVSSAYSTDQDKSDASLQTRANLSGSVLVKFKSETFPLEKLSSADERSAVAQKSAR